MSDKQHTCKYKDMPGVHKVTTTKTKLKDRRMSECCAIQPDSSRPAQYTPREENSREKALNEWVFALVMKVICAGAPKTGTKSIAKALRVLGYDPVYDAEEAIEFAFSEWEDLFEGRQIDLRAIVDKYENVEAVVDMPHASFVSEFLKTWPEAKVILMTRDEDDWYNSYKKMVVTAGEKYTTVVAILGKLSPTMTRFRGYMMKLFAITVGEPYPNEFLWKSWYRRHNTFVRATVPDDQLFEFNVKEGWEPLCLFLGKAIPDEAFPFENTAQCPENITDKIMQETWIVKKAKSEILRALTACFAVALALLVYWFI